MQLTIFNEIDFPPALKAFFRELNVPINYVDDKPTSAKKILQDTYKENESFKLINDVYFVGVVDDAAFRGGKSLAIDKIKSDYDGIIIFGVTLNNRDGGLLPTRSQLAEIARAFNREFCCTPVVVVFKYGEYLAFANTERSKYKRDREGEKAGKVTLLRDIDIRQPHSGHERILANLAISTTGKNKVDSFASLYKYWQEVLSVSLLNKKFYQDISNWYFWAVGRVTFPSEPTLLEAQAKKVSLEDLQKEHKAKNVIRLLTRLLFVWFIKEKGLIPKELFELDDLQRESRQYLLQSYFTKSVFCNAQLSD
jgi:adenine-specific DNA-methyltransferase